jgi:two-component system, response regulator
MRYEDVQILLVEDNPDDVAFTKRVLRKSKLDSNLEVAGDGLEAKTALEKMANSGSLPSMVLLDINLPDISGIDLLTKLKADPRFKDIPVVMLTGSNTDDDIQKSYDLGASTYLVKPISSDALMIVMKMLFS